MSHEPETPQTADQAEATSRGEIERGTYEIIRDRLIEQGRALADKATHLNTARLDLFGGTEMVVIGNERIRTENNCVPRDIVEAGGNLLFGYNVFLGLKRDTAIDDVLSLHRFEQHDGSFKLDRIAADFLTDERFVDAFHELYRYYSSARLIQLRHIPGKLLAVFQVGATPHDIKVFQWAVEPEGAIRYIDNRGEREHVFPPSHDFEWTATTREQHVAGRHPHVNILDQVFVETVGGDLTVKIEDNTEDGLGIYREPVDDPDQSLDDAEIQYAKVGVLILLKIRPYREEALRYLAFNTRTKSVSRIDGIGLACVQLPEDHGIVFPGGYYLQSGETKTFETDISDLELMDVTRSPNGEDVLYTFHSRASGQTLLLPYNMIRKEIANPIRCSGYSLFDDGKMVVFRNGGADPTRVHPMQIWQTPFCSDEFAADAPSSGSELEKIGNADLVRGISDAYSLVRMTSEQQPTLEVYEDLIAAATRVLDAYFWLSSDTVGDLEASIREIRGTAELIIDEFEKVEQIKAQAREAVARAEADVVETIRRISPRTWRTVDAYVEMLGELRSRRGQLITLRDLRYVDLETLEALEARVLERFDELSELTVGFLTGAEALDPYREQIDELTGKIDDVGKVADAEPVQKRLVEIDTGLQLLTEVVTGLEISDATQRTVILESISEVLGSLNRVRAQLAARRKELLSAEAVAEFAAQFKVLSASVASSLAMADSPERCDAELSKMMLALEEMEGRFTDFDEFMEQLATKREEIYEAFTGKKQTLLDQRQRRASHMQQAAERILDSISRRSLSFGDVDELNAYFASDAMVTKVRDLAAKLRALGDSVKADDVEARLKSARQEAARAQKDRKDIFEEGAEVIRLGRHRFSVNTQSLDLTMVPRDGEMYLHLTGTDLYEPIDDPEFESTREYWDQQLPSETPEVYRAEYLASTILADAEARRSDLSLDKLRLAALEPDGLLSIVRSAAAGRYDEGYERGVHDHDAALILDKVLGLHATSDLLRYAPAPRALACLFWAHYLDEVSRSMWQRRARSLGRLRHTFARSDAIPAFTAELQQALAAFFDEQHIEAADDDLRVAAEYLFEELAKDPISFITSAEAVALRKSFLTHLRETGGHAAFEDDLRELQHDLTSRHDLTHAWLQAFLDETGAPEILDLAPARDEAAALLLTEAAFTRTVSHALTTTTVDGLLGQHPRISGRSMSLRLDELLSRLGRFRNHRVPGYRAYQEARHRVLERERRRLRLTEYMPRVMSAFVRNKLINEVYLPLIGDNLAKQIGSLGEGKRTDLMGMLLLISPPGYGKTTLMEYIANRLGLIFMKINGPAMGHAVTSLDPAEAPNATARQEVEKINLAFEMGNNVMLYIDDIQHTDSELLQKFISLCDAQRKVEGVWRGETRTYDLRGKRFCVAMAGNPYTESGKRFKIPDMLANRADTYNLGDILEGRDEQFALSYLENALTSNPVLAPLTTRAQEDVYLLVRMARGEPVQADQLSHPYSAAELGEILSVLRKLITAQQVLLAVNQEYIRSASQEEAFRTEPRFQLQGSYRNMNRLAERIVPVMNEAEVEALLDDHYAGEAQTLTTGAEHNLLKLAELRRRMTEEQQRRWTEIKRSFQRVQALGGDDDDPVARVTGTLGLMSDRLAEIGQQIVVSREHLDTRQDAGLGDQLLPIVDRIREAMTEMAAARAAAAPADQPSSTADPELVRHLTTQLGTLSDGVAGISRAIVAARSEAQAPPAAQAGSGELATLLARLDQTLVALADARSAAPAAAPASEALAGYLDGLNQTLARLSHQGGTRIVQTLQPGVHDLLERLEHAIEAGLLDLLRAISRRLKATGQPLDANLGAMMDRSMKNLDTMKDLVRDLRKIDTGALAEAGGPES